MGILSQISKNLFRTAHTRRPDALVPHPEGFRGSLQHDPGLCTACGACVYVCSPGALAVDRPSPVHAAWDYQQLKCTFCGRCVDYCPAGALSFAPQFSRPQFEILPVRHEIPSVPCPRCGEPVIPLPLLVLEKTYGGPVSPEIEHLNRMCERCRKLAHGERIKHGFTGA